MNQATSANGLSDPQPFSFRLEEAVLTDLRARLRNVRWPDEVQDAEWRYGAALGYMQELVAYWRDRFDWRAQEAKLNQFRQYTVPLAGIEVHFIHQPGVGPNPLPLLLSHGWPGSVVEFQQLIPLLTDPARFGADAADAFTVIAPSLPGYTFSFQPNQRRFGAVEIAQVFGSLMTEVLGFQRYAAQGGDWGAFITSRLALDHPERLHGIHLNLLAVRRDLALVDGASEEERLFLQELQRWLREETGYQWIMGTKPQTLAYGLTDSPVGLAAWIIEKFRTWSDCAGDVDAKFGKDTLLTNIMLYWVTGAINSACWPYYARHHGPWPLPDGARVAVPTAYAAFPKEIVRPPRSLAERFYNIQRWTEMPRGGHFAALEEPEALAADMRAFFRQFR